MGNALRAAFGEPPPPSVRTDPLTGTAEPTHIPTRARYQSALCRLPRLWPEMSRRHKLAPDDFLALSWLLSQQPGRVLRLAVRVPKETKKPGLAETLGWPRARVNRSLARLRAAALVIAVLYRHRKSDQFPFGARNVPTTNTLRVFVRVDTIERFDKNDPSDGSFNDPSTGSLSPSDFPSYPNPPSRTRRRSGARTRSKASQTPGSSVDLAPVVEAATAPERDREATNEKEHEPDHAPESAAPAKVVDLESAVVDELAETWDAEKIPELGGTVSTCRPSERAAIRRALAQVGRERIALAILGTRADTWLRGGHARCAVAWVFRKGNAGVDHYAQLGADLQRQLDAQRAAAARKRAEDLARDAAFQEAEQARLERARRWDNASPEERERIAASWKNPFRP